MFLNSNLKRQFSSKISFQDVDLNKNEMQLNEQCDSDSSIYINESTICFKILISKQKCFVYNKKHSQWTMQ